MSFIQRDCPYDPELQPADCVPDNDRWLTRIIRNTLACLQDHPQYEYEDRVLFYIGLEKEFDCPARDCIEHTNWSFHVKRIKSDDETIQGSYDLDCLTNEFEGWIESFLETSFPSISFDFNSLIQSDSLPQIRLY